MKILPAFFVFLFLIRTYGETANGFVASEDVAKGDLLYIAYYPFIGLSTEGFLWPVAEDIGLDVSKNSEEDTDSKIDEIRLKVIDEIFKDKIAAYEEILADARIPHAFKGVYSLDDYIKEISPFLPDGMEFVFFSNLSEERRSSLAKIDLPSGYSMWYAVHGILVDYYYVVPSVLPDGSILLSFSFGKKIFKTRPEVLQKEFEESAIYKEYEALLKEKEALGQ